MRFPWENSTYCGLKQNALKPTNIHAFTKSNDGLVYFAIYRFIYIVLSRRRLTFYVQLFIQNGFKNTFELSRFKNHLIDFEVP